MSIRTALVTGAGSGIGRAVTLSFLAAGWNVVLCGRGVERLNETVVAAGSDGGQAFVQTADISHHEEVERLFAAAVERFGRLDVLFNNAGTSTPYAMIDEVAVDAWDRVVAVNLTGAFLCAREAFKVMRAQSPQGGRIINNGSVSAHSPRPGSTPYTVTKHAITGLTKSLALDGRAYSIAASQIDIGNAATDMTQKMQAGVRQADGQLRAEPVMDVRHVADSVLHMASLPLDANVLSMLVMASAMPLVGRG